MTQEPLISVLMPVYNAAPWVAEAIASVQAQSIRDFELLAIDDGSQDSSADIVRELSLHDSRIRLIRQQNAGVGAALNHGLREARGQFIARMDSDDIMVPADRFAKQIAIMTQRPDIAVVAGMHETFPGTPVVSNYPADPHIIKATMLFRNCVSHPTVLIRAELLGEGKITYNEARQYPEDYDLWVRLLKNYSFLAIPEIFLRYRQTQSQTIVRHREKFLSAALEIQLRQISWLGITPTEDEKQTHHQLAENQLPHDVGGLLACVNWLQKILDANTVAGVYEPAALRRVLTGRWIASAKKLATVDAAEYQRQKQTHWFSGVTIAMP